MSLYIVFGGVIIKKIVLIQVSLAGLLKVIKTCKNDMIYH